MAWRGAEQSCIKKTVLTVTFYLSLPVFEDETELGPFGKVLQVETDVIGFGQVVQVALVEFEEIHRTHWSKRRHPVQGDVYAIGK